MSETSTIDMTFKELVDYTGYSMRPATDHELSIVVDFLIDRLYTPDFNLTKKEFRERFREGTLDELKNCSHVNDYPLLNVRVFMYHTSWINVVNDHESDQKVENPTIHDHLCNSFNALRINNDDTVSAMISVSGQICLKP